MLRFATGAMSVLLLTISLSLIGCQNSGGSSGQAENATTSTGDDTTTVNDRIGLSTGGERASANYRLQLNIGEAVSGGSQQRASSAYQLTLGIGDAQQVELGE